MSARDVIADFVGKCLEIQWNDGSPINPGATADLVAEGLAALDAAGYAVVPKEPTEAMTEAASGAWYQHRSSTEMYRAMLTAAKDPT